MSCNYFKRLAIPLVALLITGEAASAPLIMSKSDQQRAGIVLTTLKASQMARSVPALGAVLDPAPLLRLSGNLATLEAQVAAAQAKVVLERQQMSQASSLFKQQTTSLANYQKAAEDLAANEALLKVARAKLAAELAASQATWGTTIASILRDNADPLSEVTAGKTMLVALSLPPGNRLASPPQNAEAEAADIHFSLRLIAPVPGMLGGYPGQSILYQAATQPGVPVGATVSASLPTEPPRAGVFVPASAVVWRHGHALAFHATDNRFEPVQIATDSPSKNGYFVSSGLTGGDRVVVQGAAILLGLLDHGPDHPDGD